MKIWIQLALILTLAWVFTGCTKEVTNLVTQPANPATAPAEPNTGSADVGGGNGLCGKPIESFAIDITTLKEYQTVVLPIGQKLAKVSDEDRPKEDKNKIDRDFFQSVYKLRTWYIACIDLQVIEKDKIGIGFSKDPVEQLALQTEFEVFIDGKKWDKMSVTERGQLLLHELIMTYYQIRYQHVADLCLLNDNGCDKGFLELLESSPDFAAFFEPPERKALEPKDYSQIRGATSFLLNHFESISSDKHLKERVWKYFGFDQRLYDNPFDGSETKTKLPEDFKLDHTQISQLLVSASLSQGLPSYCDINAKGIAESRCKVEIAHKIWSEEEKEKMLDFASTSSQQPELLTVRLDGKSQDYFISSSGLNAESNLSICPSSGLSCLDILLMPYKPLHHSWFSVGEGAHFISIKLEVTSFKSAVEAEHKLLVAKRLDALQFKKLIVTETSTIEKKIEGWGTYLEQKGTLDLVHEDDSNEGLILTSSKASKKFRIQQTIPKKNFSWSVPLIRIRKP